MGAANKIRAELARGAVIFAASEVADLLVEIGNLEEDSRFLARLHAAGVDNWDGYYLGFEDNEEDED